MRDLRDGEYLSPIQHNADDEDNITKLKGDFTWVTREEFNRKIKELERKIALLEARNNFDDGWGRK